MLKSVFHKDVPILWPLFARRKKRYEIYTDGSLKEGRGAWAYVILENSRVVSENSGRGRRTTCTRMEFQAAIEALRALPKGSRATLYTDSRILVDTLTLWIPEWKEQGWTKRQGQAIPSLDQILVLDELNQQHEIAWKWVKAHSGVPFNERCDQLCILARSKDKS